MLMNLFYILVKHWDSKTMASYKLTKTFKYCQIDYPKYPSVEELDKMGAEGWELVCIELFETKMWDDKLECHYTKKFNKATFKREIIYKIL